MGFDLDYPDDNNVNNNNTSLQLTWRPGQEPHPEQGRAWLRQQRTRLHDVRATALQKRDPRIVSDHEWNVIVQYHDALDVALRAAWRALTGTDVDNDDESVCRSVGDNAANSCNRRSA